MEKHKLKELIKILGEDKCKLHEPMSAHTSLKIGGPADILASADSKKSLEKAQKEAIRLKIPYFVLGSGTNILVADKGIRGLVIKNTSSNIEIINKIPSKKILSKIKKSKPRLDQPDAKEFIKFDDLYYDESKEPLILVRADSGISVQLLFNKLITKGITGLQWFGGIPGTLGGGVYVNIHGGSEFLGDRVVSAEFIDKKGNAKKVDNEYLDFDYDQSKIQETKDTVTSVDLLLHTGDATRAKETFKEWTKRKSIQPRISSGSVFRTLPEKIKNNLDLPTGSAGYILDKVLGLKGTKIGGAQVSERHANFIINAGDATAKDYRKLIDLCKQKTMDRLGVELVEEIEYVGEFN